MISRGGVATSTPPVRDLEYGPPRDTLNSLMAVNGAPRSWASSNTSAASSLLLTDLVHSTACSLTSMANAHSCTRWLALDGTDARLRGERVFADRASRSLCTDRAGMFGAAAAGCRCACHRPIVVRRLGSANSARTAWDRLSAIGRLCSIDATGLVAAEALTNAPPGTRRERFECGHGVGEVVRRAVDPTAAN